MTGSVWAPGSITTVNSANTVVPENQVGTQGQTLITLLNFTYPPNTNSILLWINGVLQASGIDYTEASASTLLLASGLTLGDRITVLGLTAIIGSTSALTFVRPSGSLFLNGFSATPAAIGPGLLVDYGFVANQGRIASYDWATATYKDLSIDANNLKLNTLSNGAISTGTGLFTVNGRAVFTDGATYTAEIASGGASTINIGGTAGTLNTNLRVSGTTVVALSTGTVAIPGILIGGSLVVTPPTGGAAFTTVIGPTLSAVVNDLGVAGHIGLRVLNGVAGGTVVFTVDSQGSTIIGPPAGLVGSALTVNANASGGVAAGIYNKSAGSPYGLEVQFTAAAPNDATRQFLRLYDNVADRAIIRSNGGFANFQANDVNLSDSRLKKNWAKVESYYDRHLAIEYGYFLYKDQTDADRNLGKLAQQVYSVMPELVDISGFGNCKLGELPYMGIYETDYTNMLGAVLQETQQRLNKLATAFSTYVAAHP